MGNLFAVTKYESLMLLRTWKFWILAVICLFFPVIITVIFILMERFGGNGPGWVGLEGAKAYMMFYIYNIFQILAVIFLTSDFRDKDVKAQVNEVMCSRSITNIEYITGKYLGIISPLLIVTFAVVLILSLIDLILNDSWGFSYYIYYLFVLNLPGLMFITAFVIFASSLMRNTIIVFVVVLVYTIATIYFGSQHAFSLNRLWIFPDYLGFHLPFFPSDLVDILDVKYLLLQRLFYLCLGGFFLGLSIVFFYPRLRQSRLWANLTIIGIIGCITISGSIFFNALIRELNRRDIENEILTEKFTDFDSEEWAITGYKLEYKLFDGNTKVKSKSSVFVKKLKQSGNSEIPFILNNGLNVSDVSNKNGKKLTFRQNGIDLIVDSGENLRPGSEYEIIMEYSGDIDTRGLFLARGKNDMGEMTKMTPRANYVPALMDDRFSFLLPESYWYPQLYNPYSFNYPDRRPHHFFTGEWKFDVPEHLTAISQGENVSIDSTSSPGRRIFEYDNSVPVKGISLNVGSYNKYSMEISGKDFQLYISERHDNLVQFFKEIKADVETIFTDAMRGIEEITGLDYPYPSLSYVEVPMSIQWYQDNGLHRELNSQPGIVMVSEDLLMKSFKNDFDRQRRNADKKKIQKTDAEIKKEIFIDMIIDQMFNDEFWFFQKFSTPIASFWSHRVNFTGNLYPLYEYYFDKYLEKLITKEIRFYLTNQEQKELVGNPMRTWQIENLYRVPMDTLQYLIRNTPLNEIIPTSESNNFHAIMMYKSGSLNDILRELVTPEKFKQALHSFVETNSYSNVTFKDFQESTESYSRENLDWFFVDWLSGKAYPGYFITALDAYKIKGGPNGVQYLVELKLKNGEPDPGYVKVRLSCKDDWFIKRTAIKGNQELLFSYLVDDLPQKIIINPIFSQNVNNIEQKVRVPDDFEKREPWDGIRETSSDYFTAENIVIDDMDAGFTITSSGGNRYLRPSKGESSWRVRNSASAFGKYRYTYRRKRSASSISSAKWEAEIPMSGIYLVETFIYRGDSEWEEKYLGKRMAPRFKYIITHGEGSSETFLEWRNSEHGWNEIGRFYFEKGQKASVVLSDEANGELIADAVRFVPVEFQQKPDSN